MEDLLQSQIQDSCRLALPIGLQELMSDISREVLRAQPHNLLKFITNYLSTLLITRENLSVAARVCSDICDCSCQPELYNELCSIGLDEDSASDAKDIIEEFFGKGEVNEGHLLLKLLKKTSIDGDKLPEVVAATRRAFLRHQRNHTQIYETSSNSDDDEATKAARHTLGLYRKTDPSYETYNYMAQKIQASYRAYRERRHLEKTGTDCAQSSERSSKVTFGTFDITKGSMESMGQLDTWNNEDMEPFEMQAAESQKQPMLYKISSMSLAGSHVNLPKYIPYSVHDNGHLMEFNELPETERSNYDYTRENKLIVKRVANIDMTKHKEEKKDKKILFYEPVTEQEDSAEEVDDETVGEFIVEEAILESIVEEGIVEGDIVKESVAEEFIEVEGREVIIEESIVEEDMVQEDIAGESVDEENINEKDEDTEVTVKGGQVDEHGNYIAGESKAEDSFHKAIVEGGIVEGDIVEEDIVEDDEMVEDTDEDEYFEDSVKRDMV